MENWNCIWSAATPAESGWDLPVAHRPGKIAADPKIQGAHALASILRINPEDAGRTHATLKAVGAPPAAAGLIRDVMVTEALTAEESLRPALQELNHIVRGPRMRSRPLGILVIT